MKYISESLFNELAGEVKRLRQLLNGYIGFLKNSKTGEKEFPGKSILREPSDEYEIYRDDQHELPNNELTNNEFPKNEEQDQT